MTAEERAEELVENPPPFIIHGLGVFGGRTWPDEHLKAIVTAAIRAAVAAEREACAAALDGLYQRGPSRPYPRGPWGAGVLDGAEVVRARGGAA